MITIHRIAAITALLWSASAAAESTLQLRQPAVSENHLAFVYAGDIWIAGRDGRNPRRLTTHPAEEGLPFFSPDGTMLAFAGDYENNRDVYVLAVDGGQPRRLTWHPGADTPTGWTADGSAVTFMSAREMDHGRSGQLYHAALEGGLPVRRMAARFYRGRYSADDTRLAYIAFGSGYNGLFGGSSGWRGYRGGTTPEILIMDFDGNAVTTVPGAGATNFHPFWLGSTLYFISDRNDKVHNLFRYDDGNGELTQVTHESVWDLRWADGHGSTVVYEAGGRLKSLDVVTGVTREIVIDIAPDLPQRRVQWKDASDHITAADLSPNGKRAIVTARGEVFTVPVEDGSTRNVTATDGGREYDGLWSPQGERIAWIAESPDGQSLVVADQTGMGSTERYALGPHFYSLLTWSGGDSSRIAYTDNHLALYTIDSGDGEIRRIATGARRDQVDAAFSPDGTWLAYTLEQPNYQRRLVLHELATGNEVAASAGDADVAAPAFSRDGQYLYFAASTNSGPAQVGLNMTSQERPYRAGLYALVLAADGASPLEPESGDETAASDEENGDDEAEAGNEVETRIDIDGLLGRLVALPVAEANYRDLAVGKDGSLFYVDAAQPGAANLPPDEQAEGRNVLRRFDFEKKEAGSALTGVTGFSISAGGSHLIIGRANGSLAIAEIGDELKPEALDTGGMRMRIDPLNEWRQIFDEAWRMQQEYFYDPNMHGIDWQGIYDRYRPLVEHVGRREDLNDLIVEMIAELQVGHNRASGGDVHRESGAREGLLGANFRIDNDRYRFATVYTGELWNPFLAAPLARPGQQVRAGDYLLAINGRPISGADNVFEWLQGTTGSQVTLTVGPSANGDNARDVTVEPVASERRLRLWHWIEANRRQVSEATAGRVGYVYLPNTAGDGYEFFNRMFFSQLDRDAMIFDERSNAGGQAANYIVEVLSRQHLSGWKDRDGLVYATPAGALHGPKLMMIDQDAGSGGDYLPHTFRSLGIGKLLGTRTWGGLIGIAANPPLIDGGSLTVPFFRFYDTNHEWTIENEGVAPDIHVPLDPILTNRGRDSQLEAAIEEIERQLGEFEDPVPDQAPPYPTELGE